MNRQLLILALLLAAATSSAQSFRFERYGADRGVPEGFLREVGADSLGFVYFRTLEGWYRYDGEQAGAVVRGQSDFAGPWEIGGYRLDTSRRDAIVLRDARGRTARIDPVGAPNPKEISGVTADAQGRLWFATYDNGLYRLLPSAFRRYPTPKITALLPAGDTLWIGTWGRGLHFLTAGDDAVRPARATEAFARETIAGIARDAYGRLYLATVNDGIVVVEGRRLTRLTRRSGLPEDAFVGLLRQDSLLYALGLGGAMVGIVPNDSSFTIKEAFVADTVDAAPVGFRAMSGDGAGGLFLTTADGRIQYRHADGTVDTWDANNGLPPGDYRLLSLRRGTQLWAGGPDAQLVYTDVGERPVRFVAAGRFDFEPTVRRLLALDDEREVWVGGENATLRLELDDNGRPFYAKRYAEITARSRFGSARTFPAVRDSSGLLWFATENELLRFDAKVPEEFLPPPPTRLTGVSLFYDTLSPTAENHFTSTENHFGFTYRAADLTYPDRVRYRHRLRPLEREWSPALAENGVRYAGLGGGRYHFEVAATADGGKTWGRADEYTFTIAAPFWRRSWFLGLVALVGSALLVLGFYGSARRIRREEEKKRRKLETTNRLLELEQKALRLQMNPHFIFNALNGIRGLIDGEHDAEARQQIGRFATLMRGLLNNSRAERISLAAELAMLEDYLKMEQFCQPFVFDYRISPPEGVDPEEVFLPPMLLQPFVENAILHGLAGRPEAGLLELEFALAGRRMRVSVTDNGIGRAAAAARRRERAPGHRSLALEVTRERLAAIRGTLSYADLEPGTRATLEFPVAYDW